MKDIASVNIIFCDTLLHDSIVLVLGCNAFYHNATVSIDYGWTHYHSIQINTKIKYKKPKECSEDGSRNTIT